MLLDLMLPSKMAWNKLNSSHTMQDQLLPRIFVFFFCKLTTKQKTVHLELEEINLMFYMFSIHLRLVIQNRV